MPVLNLKSSHKAVKNYYAELSDISQLQFVSEGAVAPAFGNLLRQCAKQFGWTLVEQYPINRKGSYLRCDGALVDAFKLVHGYWEAKDTADDLDVEIKKKFDKGYPKDNILFQSPERAVIFQNATEVFNEEITDPEKLVQALAVFFSYQPPEYERWQQAVEEFKSRVPDLAKALLTLIEDERKGNTKFIKAFDEFYRLCKQAINPNLSIQAVEEMLIQHVLTERIFRKIFANADFAQRNIIAREIEKVVEALYSRSFSRQEFLKSLDPFYVAIETTAATISEYSQKQDFLNTVYERFFQGFSVKVADTHGIVYTPQPIVDFMVRSVEEILQKEFGRSLADEGVHILDPFVGTGNFIMRVMREIQTTKLEYKYKNELHCNEVMLLPYYIASMNIEHEYFERMNQYEPFSGICLVDTFELAESKQFLLFEKENTERVKRQQKAPIFVVIGNPPYNIRQTNENDNNKNRKYPAIDKRVKLTYSKSSVATNKNALGNPYIKAMRWASDKIIQNKQGVVCLVTNNSYIDNMALDGVRKNLWKDFSQLYVLNLGGDVRKNPNLSGTTHNVFGIQHGVSINFFIKKSGCNDKKIYYKEVETDWNKIQKYEYLFNKDSTVGVTWRMLTPDRDGNWLTTACDNSFYELIAIGNKGTKLKKENTAIFKLYSIGVNSNRDAWVYSYNTKRLEDNIRLISNTYNNEARRWMSLRDKASTYVDKFVLYDDRLIKWSSRLKECLLRGIEVDFSAEKIRISMSRPFVKKYLYFDEVLIQRRGQLHNIFRNEDDKNLAICIGGYGRKPFSVFAVDITPDLNLFGDPQQCFPFSYYDKKYGKKDNISAFAIDRYHAYYKDIKINTSDIFYYVYAILHHGAYRGKYAANLKREFPRIPFAPDFWAFAEAGKKLVEMHVSYEQQPEYPLKFIETEGKKLDWRVSKMKLSKDKTRIIYNDFLTLEGIPPEVFTYRLGNRSALEWVIDQYQVKIDKRSGIVSDPNRDDDPKYIVRLIGQVIHVSLETMKIVNSLPKEFE